MYVTFIVVLYIYYAHRDLHVLTHPFPPRRPSALLAGASWPLIAVPVLLAVIAEFALLNSARRIWTESGKDIESDWEKVIAVEPGLEWLDLRSEEHTSELQSLMRISYAVFCLKKKISSTHKYTEKQCVIV